MNVHKCTHICISVGLYVYSHIDIYAYSRFFRPELSIHTNSACMHRDVHTHTRTCTHVHTFLCTHVIHWKLLKAEPAGSGYFGEPAVADVLGIRLEKVFRAIPSFCITSNLELSIPTSLSNFKTLSALVQQASSRKTFRVPPSLLAAGKQGRSSCGGG